MLQVMFKLDDAAESTRRKLHRLARRYQCRNFLTVHGPSWPGFFLELANPGWQETLYNILIRMFSSK
jgi:hypothetical protein